MFQAQDTQRQLAATIENTAGESDALVARVEDLEARLKSTSPSSATRPRVSYIPKQWITHRSLSLQQGPMLYPLVFNDKRSTIKVTIKGN